MSVTEYPTPSGTRHYAARWLAEHGDLLYGYALSRSGGDAAVAEDLVQETLLAAIDAFDRFQGESKVETWLVGILRRKIIDRYRRQQRKCVAEPDDIFDGAVFDADGGLHDVVGWQAEACQQVESQEFAEVFDRCLADLAPPLAEAFTVCVMDELSTDEACRLLDITPKNLSVRLHRARLGLRKLLQTRWFGRAS